MSRRIAVIACSVVLAALTACHHGSSGPGLRLQKPTSVAVFRGYSHVHPELYPYAAVASSARDELVLFDPVDDKELQAPILIRPLSIPLAMSQPAVVATAAFKPPDSDPRPRPDLLVVVGAASSQLQLVRTWKDESAGDPGLADGDPIDLGGPVLALVATPAVDAAGGIVPDRVRVVAALTEGRLAVVEYAWSGDPETGGGAAATSAAPVVLTPGFDALSLAVDASLTADHTLRNPAFLYAATRDPIGTEAVEGVAEIDMRADPTSWTVRGIRAGAPTVLVAAFTLQERRIDAAGAVDQSTRPSVDVGGPGSFQTAAVSRVYAYRDPGACGRSTTVDCGIAVLDPAAGDVLENPWHVGETPRQDLPPIAVPARPVALVPGPPAWNPPTSDTNGLESDDQHRFMLLDTSAGPRLTTGVLFIPSEDGRSYVADLARWEIPSDTAEVSGAGTQTRTISWVESVTGMPRIGLYLPPNVAAADAANGSSGRPAWDPDSGAAAYLRLTPGFTPDDVWTVTYQGYLPDFVNSRPARVEDAGGGMLRIWLQSTSGTQVANVHDPAHGVRVGDIVEFWTVGSGASPRPDCPDTSDTQISEDGQAPIEGKIVEIQRPDATHPGGSLLLQKGDCVPVALAAGNECNARDHGPWNDRPGCWASLPGTDTQQVRIRAGGGGAPDDAVLVGKELVVAGTSTGYAGRATSVAEGTAFPAFQLTNDGEATLTEQCNAACPGMIPYPADPTAAPACDEASRRICEDAWVARRARRTHLTSAFCFVSSETTLQKNNCQTQFPEFAQPIASEAAPAGSFVGEPPAGPALAFSLGIQLSSPLATLPVRDSQITFTTKSGWAPLNRYGGGANDGPATGPMGAAYFDRSFEPGWGKQGDRYRFFVPHVGNLILDTSPAHSNSSAKILR